MQIVSHVQQVGVKMFWSFVKLKSTSIIKAFLKRQLVTLQSFQRCGWVHAEALIGKLSQPPPPRHHKSAHHTTL